MFYTDMYVYLKNVKYPDSVPSSSLLLFSTSACRKLKYRHGSWADKVGAAKSQQS